MRKLVYGLFVIYMSSFGAAYASESAENVLTKISTAAKQTQMTPAQALSRLKEGNQRFLTNNMQKRDLLTQAKTAATYGQFPWAVVLNCMDSRSVPEIFFDQGLADLFILRVAGNILNDDILGSMEFATKAAGSRLIVVLGHTSCGAVAGACQNVRLGHLDHVLDKIQPVISESKKQVNSEDCNNSLLIDQIAKNNALQVVAQIRQQSPIINDLLEKGEVGIVAGIHDIKTGKVTFFEESRIMSDKPEKNG